MLIPAHWLPCIFYRCSSLTIFIILPFNLQLNKRGVKPTNFPDEDVKLLQKVCDRCMSLISLVVSMLPGIFTQVLAYICIRYCVPNFELHELRITAVPTAPLPTAAG